jgi:ribosomal protein S4
MLLLKKKRYKPFYKQFLRLRINIQNREKVFRFRKKKWEQFQFHASAQLKFFKRYKFKDQFRLFAKKFASQGNSFKKHFRNISQERQLFSLFYGGLKKKYLKTQIVKAVQLKNIGSLDMRHRVVQFFENRLDTVLYRVGFCSSVKEAKKFVLHKHVLVNQKYVMTGSYILKPNDLIELSDKSRTRNFVKQNLRNFVFWPIPAKHLLINYKTLQILILNTDSLKLTKFNRYLNLSSIVSNLNKW